MEKEKVLFSILKLIQGYENVLKPI